MDFLLFGHNGLSPICYCHTPMPRFGEFASLYLRSTDALFGLSVFPLSISNATCADNKDIVACEH